MSKKKDAALHGLSKKDRKKLEKKAATLQAELEARAKKKAAKANKKVKPPKPEKPAPVETVEQPTEESAKARTIKAAKKTEAHAGNAETKADAKLAQAAAAEAGDDETDEQIKKRLAAKRERRAAHEAAAADVDRSDEAAVKAYNDELLQLGGGTFLTSDAENAKMDARLKPAKKADAPAPEPEQTVEKVETETGHVFAAGAAGPTNEELQAGEAAFAKPSEAPKTDFETNGNGQYKIKRPSDGKIVGYTRVTTYIANLEDTSNLTKWKLRILLEGVAINDTPDSEGRAPDPVVATLRELLHVRDVAIAKAMKADKKGKLDVGELGTIIAAAWKDYKRAVDIIADELLEVGGVHEKANKGTDLHALCELYDAEGIDAVGDLLTAGSITPADLADVEAYARAIEAAGIKILAQEQVVVQDDLKVAGRLDRIVMAKLPGMARATRMVADIKTGRVDYSVGKIAQQIELYAGATGYDLNTHERTDLKVSRTKGLLIHLPAGTATCTIHVVDLSLGRVGNALSGQVREWRNTGKRAIDFDTDLAKPVTA